MQFCLCFSHNDIGYVFWMLSKAKEEMYTWVVLGAHCIPYRMDGMNHHEKGWTPVLVFTFLLSALFSNRLDPLGTEARQFLVIDLMYAADTKRLSRGFPTSRRLQA
ncbi:hypothetical protein MPTK1_1g07920 [Marchantia polymorpha subsp. ruderalis]|uniref:Uncharacterized protein n=2 Tax=Marchantia polymorpha TaxID=3197 RepID=A0AAF6AMR9_MARPO|nr:hypothetical protein MARPO_0036s0036 [Marchantia polymorpha]BBM97739.1 hypothetical protein Mp_1g07920 [Marchantia polymorpha subsp. ruderalis]|eukprot:PTQ41042.1 hypothetical protein MARPO_0036s0036 [Marchantia polymorpha]